MKCFLFGFFIFIIFLQGGISLKHSWEDSQYYNYNVSISVYLECTYGKYSKIFHKYISIYHSRTQFLYNDYFSSSVKTNKSADCSMS